MGTRFSRHRTGNALTRAGAVLLLSAGCSMWPSGPLDGESRVAERGFAPWLVASLETCLDDDCSATIGQSVQSADLRLVDGRFEVVLARADGIYLGVLDPAGSLTLSSPPILTPTEPWQASGLVDPTWLVIDDRLQVLYATADGTSLGRAELGPAGWVDGLIPWATSATLGVDSITGPTAVRLDGRLLVLFASDAGIEGLAGDSLEPLGVVLDAAHVATARWTAVDRIQDPTLTLLADGSLGLFFAARGRLATSDPSAPADFSIGFAGTADGLSYEPYADNPVHDQVSTLIFHADEAAPAVAFVGGRGLMLCKSERGGSSSLSLAVHDPR